MNNEELIMDYISKIKKEIRQITVKDIIKISEELKIDEVEVFLFFYNRI